MGNPGPRFDGTRHNVGYEVVGAVAAVRDISLKKPFLSSYEWTGRGFAAGLVLARPLTYMNRSGWVFPSLMRRCRCELSDLVVVCDNLDLPVGAVRLKRNGKSRSHNGLASIMDVLGTGDFTRIYIGIGRPQEGCSVVDHVLGVPTEDETQLYANAVSRAAWAAEALLDRGIETVMNDLNRKP